MLSNNESIVNIITTHVGLGESDHALLIIYLNLISNADMPKIPERVFFYYYYNNADFDSMNSVRLT